MFEAKIWTGNLPSSRRKTEKKGTGAGFLRIYTKKENNFLFIYIYLFIS